MNKALRPNLEYGKKKRFREKILGFFFSKSLGRRNLICYISGFQQSVETTGLREQSSEDKRKDNFNLLSSSLTYVFHM